MAGPMLKIKKILIVDDDIEMIALLRDFLQHQGYQVTTTSSVAGALRWLNASSPLEAPDLIVSDVKMGATSGIELSKKILLERPLLPVILYSVFEGHEKEALQSGARRFLRKPFELSNLAKVIAEILF